MKNIWKVLGLSLLLIAPSFALSACGNDDDGQDGQPAIFTELEEILNHVDSASDAVTFERGLGEYKLQAGNNLKVACEEYGDIRNKNKTWDNIVNNNRNGGYYLAMYIHLNNLQTKVRKFAANEKAMEDFNDLFAQYDGCRNLLQDARDATKSR